MKKKILSLLLATLLLCSSIPAASAAGFEGFRKCKTYTSGLFTDVSDTAWYANNVRTAYELGLMIGNGDGTFNPLGNIQFIEAIVVSCRLHSIYMGDQEEFIAAEGESWYAPYIRYANRTRIMYIYPYGEELPSDMTEGTLLLAYPSEATLLTSITRGQFAMMLAHAMPEETLPTISTIAIGAIPDVQLNDYYASEVYLLYAAGVLTGNDSIGTFGPDENIQRCAAAAIISRLADPTLRIPISLTHIDFTPPALESLPHYDALRRTMNDEEYQQAYDAAVELVTPYCKLDLREQLYYVAVALREITDSGLVYSMSEPHYNDPYGFLIKKCASCAGCARATGLCLDILGIPYEHVNDNLYTHQWCRVPVGDEYWICDAFGLYCGPEPAPYEHPYL